MPSCCETKDFSDLTLEHRNLSLWKWWQHSYYGNIWNVLTTFVLLKLLYVATATSTSFNTFCLYIFKNTFQILFAVHLHHFSVLHTFEACIYTMGQSSRRLATTVFPLFMPQCLVQSGLNVSWILTCCCFEQFLEFSI